MKKIIDIECSNLLQPSLDYSKMPYRLLPEFKVWCIVIRDVDTDEVVSLSGDDLTKFNLKKALKGTTELIGHNIIQFDLPILMLYGLFDYEVGYPNEASKVFNQDVVITDTLLWSKLFNPDRFGGHSLSVWGKRLGEEKIEFNDFSKYTEELENYCIQDTKTNAKLYLELEKELNSHNWSQAIQVETKLYDLALKRELFGFQFDKVKAEKCIEELEQLMKKISDVVNPILPNKKMTQGELFHYTPSKIQLKKDGSLSTNFIRFCNQIGAKVSQDYSTMYYKDKSYPLPYHEPLENSLPADIEDMNNLKGYLLSLGWKPTEWKERDLVKKANKTSRTEEEIVVAIERYVKETKNSEFKSQRCELLECTIESLDEILKGRIDGSKPIYIPTAPKLTIGLDKHICPNLLALGEKAEFAKDVSLYYTYRHRKNSIIGTKFDEEDEPITGFLSAVRVDGRVPTPADTIGANTGRYRHKVVCNIPRVTSLYGEQMRSLFGAGKKLWQVGFDFASLEARVQGHYCIPYKDGESLARSLVAEKPNDLHSITALKLGIDRDSAKSTNYAVLYGAQPKKLSKMLGLKETKARKIYNGFWEAVPALKQLKDRVESHWNSNNREFILGLDGRKLVTRSKHSLLNVLFQAGGAIIAKWSTVNIAKEFEDLNLLGNPFVNKETDVKIWMMIEMHDECQYACHPSLLKVDIFETKEQAEANKNLGDSGIGHGSKGYYISRKTTPIECIDKGIADSCKFLKLKVPMGFEHMAGLNWAQCH